MKRGNVRPSVGRKNLPYVNVQWLGAGPNRTGAENRAIMQYALDNWLVVLFGGHRMQFDVAGKLVVRNNHRLLFEGARLTQKTNNTQLFDCDGKTGIEASGGVFYGVGDDFINASTLSDCFRALGAGTIKVSDSQFFNFAGCPLNATAATEFVFERNKVRGPVHMLVPVTSGTCCGPVADGASSNVRIIGNDIAGVSQGIIVSNNNKSVTISDNQIHDLVGQHGMYLGSGIKGLTISGNTLDTISLQGIKIQQHDSYGQPCEDVSIIGNTIRGCGSHGILLASTSATHDHRFRGVAIISNTISTSGEDGIQVGYTTDGSITNNTIRTTSRDGIRVTALDTVSIEGNKIRGTASNGIRELAACVDCDIINNRINDCCTANTVNEEHGIYLTAGSNWIVRDNKIRDAAANMRYGIFSSTINQPTCSFRNNDVTGASDFGARFYGTSTAAAEITGNSFVGASGATLNGPTMPVRSVPRFFRGDTAPTTGPHIVGDVFLKNAPTAGQSPGAILTSSTPSLVWKSLPALEA